MDGKLLLLGNTGSDVVECSAPSGSASSNGNTDQVQRDWGEHSVANGDDDSRTVSIEVRPKSGQCMPQYTWQLEVEGN